MSAWVIFADIVDSGSQRRNIGYRRALLLPCFSDSVRELSLRLPPRGDDQIIMDRIECCGPFASRP